MPDLKLLGIVQELRDRAEPATYVEMDIASKRLVALLDDWAPPSVGFFLYYPSRRQMPAALQVLIDVLKAQAR
jgi:DNA-binding transcriptional LysR family regulator